MKLVVLIVSLGLASCQAGTYAMKQHAIPVEHISWDGEYKMKYYSNVSVVLIEYRGEVKGYVINHISDKVLFLPEKNKQEGDYYQKGGF